MFWVFVILLRFSSGLVLKEGDNCHTATGAFGKCLNMLDCDDLVFPGVDPASRFCDLTGDMPIVCCSHDELKTLVRAPISLPPKCTENFRCGYQYDLAFFQLKTPDALFEIYHFNKTAANMTADGFDITINSVYQDAITDFNYSNGSVSGNMNAQVEGRAPVGGRPATFIRAFYMALLGRREGGEPTWLCDGVLINKQWVLTAAHCFLNAKQSPNFVRLGEYDWSTEAEDRYDPQTEDHEMLDLAFHPLFKPTSRYHDLVLIKIPKPIPRLSHNINPICLPWGEETHTSHIGKNLTLTGWGATSYSAATTSKTPILQQVELDVFNSSVCDKAYQKLSDYKYKWEFGMTSETTVCAGSIEGGKDACKGDSGGPLAYEVKSGEIFLAGIVSGGFGCGLKEFPGLYTPINNYFNLEWIKKVAFTD